MNAAPSHRERDDSYAGVVAVLNVGWRVVVCRDNLQWILQRRDGARHGRARWTGRSYCRTREALIRVSRGHVGEIDAAALAILHSMPERLP